MNSILVATDFSEGAEKAIHYAKQLALLQSQKLVYLHVVNLPIVDPAITSNIVAETVDELKNDAKEKLSEFVKKDKLEGINSDFKISFNDILALIQEVGESEEVSFVVVGRSGDRTFLDKVLGSTAEGLINNISYPLLVVPEEFNGEILGRLCYASKLEHDEVDFVRKAMIWQTFSKENLMVCHVLKEHSEEINEMERQFGDNFKNGGIEFKYFLSDNYRSGITEFLNNEGVTLLFVTSHKRGFFEGIFDPSLTKQVINAIQIPVMIYNFSMP